MFTENSKTGRSRIKRRILKNKVFKEVCSICGQVPVWNNLPLVLELDHINGVRTDNRIENLRLLCPHCHSQQKTSHRKRGVKQKIFDSHIIEAAKTSKNIREVLLKLNLGDGSANYERVKPVLKKFFSKFEENFPKIVSDFNWKSAPRPSSRKVVRPSREILEEEIKKSNFSALGRKYGVSDNAIRKWCKAYNILDI